MGLNDTWDNPMYRFLDTVQNEDYIPERIPTSAMYYDGILIEGIIEGYQTLSVSGREMISVNIEADSVNAGSIISSQKLPPRILTVKYKLENKNPELLQFNFKELMRRLYRTEDVPIRFNDELDYFYYGRYNTAEEVSGSSNCIVSSFTIYCQSPIKYTREYHSKGYIATYTNFNPRITLIKVKLSRANSVKVTNGRETISITGAAVIQAGDLVEFNILKGKVFVNGEDKTRILDLTSDFKNFTLKQYDTVKTDNGTIDIYYKEVSL